MTELEKMAKGYLWGATEEYLEEQRIAKDLMYDFNQSRPSEVEKREAIAKQLFGYVGDNVFIQQPITIARGKTVSVVTKDIPANVIAIGSPCKVLRAFNERDKEYYYRNYRFDEQV